MVRIFVNRLKKQLRERIQGEIYVHVDDDTLIVDVIVNATQVWRYTISNLSLKLLTNLTSEIVTDIIVERYKKYIFERYFTNKL